MTTVVQKSIATAVSPDGESAIDWSGRWFQILEEQGEDIQIRVGLDDNDFAVRSHAAFDGVGAVVDVLSGNGVDVDVPVGRVKGVSAVKAVVTAAQFAADVPRHVDWWPRQHATTNLPVTAVKLLDEDATAGLVDEARAAGGTVTTLLLTRLAQAVAPSLTTPTHPQPWMVPVNLRGSVTAPSPLSNQVGFLTLTQNSSSTPASTKAAMAQALASGQAQATWQLNQIGRIVGLSGMKKILRSATSTGYKNVGNFSNLGTLVSRQPTTVRGVFFLPPVARSQSCAVGVVTFNGRLSISAVLHPTVRVSSTTLKQWLSDVVTPASPA